MAETIYEPLMADSTFKTSSWTAHPRWSSDMRHGYLYPCKVFEVLPSDRWSVDLRHFTRMSAPIAPFFGDVYQHYAAFFVPKRIIWNKTKQFYGEAETFGVASSVTEPNAIFNDYIVTRSYLDGPAKWCTFGSAFGLVTNEASVATSSKRIGINELPLWAYGAIYNEYFRNENYQNKYMWNKDLTGADSLSTGYMTFGSTPITAKSDLARVNKDSDIFTSILPYALKSANVPTIPLPDNVPVTGDAPIYVSLSSSANGWLHTRGDSSNNVGIYSTQSGSTQITSAQNKQFYAHGNDLSVNLSSVSIGLSSLIYSLSYQYYLNRLAKGGSKYGEYLEIMFGAKCPAATRDEPEFLGHVSFQLNVDTVLQTTGHVDGDTSELGQVGANSQTGGSGGFFNAAFTEPGYLVVLTYTKHKRQYSTSINPIFLKKEKDDYYDYPFANIPDVSMDSEIMYFTGNTDLRKSLGFVEPWLDNKVFADEAFGLLNPMNSNSSDFYTLADKYANQPTITGDFLVEDRDAIARALTTGTSGSDYIADAIFDIRLSRVMPLHSNGLGVM